MILYEVNLTLDHDIAEEFASWLEPHIKEMVDLPWFQGAKWFTTQPLTDETSKRITWTVHYEATSRQALQDYFDKDAQRMRGDGLTRFEGKFSATRRILSPKMRWATASKA